MIESGFAERDERVDAFVKIDWLVSEQDIELGDEMNHRRQGRKKSAQSRWMQRRNSRRERPQWPPAECWRRSGAIEERFR